MSTDRPALILPPGVSREAASAAHEALSLLSTADLATALAEQCENQAVLSDLLLQSPRARADLERLLIPMQVGQWGLYAIAIAAPLLRMTDRALSAHAAMLREASGRLRELAASADATADQKATAAQPAIEAAQAAAAARTAMPVREKDRALMAAMGLPADPTPAAATTAADDHPDIEAPAGTPPATMPEST